ncbi:MAG: extracellular solute-binding protein [Firmicutes bacterium]|nr:extracellular solute-binding protein [Bacillota bacterium]
MPNHRKRSLRIVLAVALVLMVAAPVVTAQTITLVHMAERVDSPATREALKAKFEEMNPDIRIEFIYTTGRPDWYEKMVTLWASDVFPDVIEVSTERAYEFARQGLFLDLNPLMKKDPDLTWDQFNPVAVELSTMPAGRPDAGARYSLPRTILVNGVGLNIDMFRQAGLTPPTEMEHHWTWDDFDEMATKLTRFGADGSVEQYAVRIPNNHYRWPTWVHNAGGWIFDTYIDPSESRLLTDPVRTALDFIFEALHVKQYAHPHQNYAGIYNSKSAMETGVVPSYGTRHRDMGFSWEIDFYHNPKLVRGGSEIATIGVAIGARTKHEEAAWKWIKFLATSEEAIELFLNERPDAPAWGPGTQLYLESDPVGAPRWIEMMTHPDAFTRPIYSLEVEQLLQQHINDIFAGTMPVDMVLEEAHRQLSILLAELKE